LVSNDFELFKSIFVQIQWQKRSLTKKVPNLKNQALMWEIFVERGSNLIQVISESLLHGREVGNLANQERERGFQQQIEELRTDNADGYNKCKIALEKGIQERRERSR